MEREGVPGGVPLPLLAKRDSSWLNAGVPRSMDYCEDLVEFRVRFYEAADGTKPLVDFLESLRARQPTLHKLVVAGLGKLRQRENHGPPLTSVITGTSGLLELRVGSTDIARVFFFYRPGGEIVCTNGYVKKSQKLDPRELAQAEHFKADWEERHP